MWMQLNAILGYPLNSRRFNLQVFIHLSLPKTIALSNAMLYHALKHNALPPF